MSKDTGGPAFPYEMPTRSGMTLRDYFAAQVATVIEPPVNYVGHHQTDESYQKWAQKVYKMADALLEARE